MKKNSYSPEKHAIDAKQIWSRDGYTSIHPSISTDPLEENTGGHPKALTLYDRLTG